MTAPRSPTSWPGLGTSGTLLGVGRYLKERNPDVKVWAIEPPAGEMVDGLRNLDDGYIPPIFVGQRGAELLDGKRSSGRASRSNGPAGSCRGGDLRRPVVGGGVGRCGEDGRGHRPRRVVVVSADGGWKYLSTGAWTGDLDVVEERAKRSPTFERSALSVTGRGRVDDGPGPPAPGLSLIVARLRRELDRAPGAPAAATWWLGRTRVLVDAGPGTFANLQRHLDPASIDAVVLSHHHPDHWTDLDGRWSPTPSRPGRPRSRSTPQPAWPSGPAWTARRSRLARGDPR